MLQYCKDKWAKNEEKLRTAISKSTDHASWNYETLVKLIVDVVLNDGLNTYGDWEWSQDIHVVDDGDYQGTLLFLIHRDMYQPGEDDYLITYVDYGSCSCCDTLFGIQADCDYTGEETVPNKRQVDAYMALCRDIVRSFKQPFNTYEAMKEVEMACQ